MMMMMKIHFVHEDTIALFTVGFSHLNYNVIQRGCEAISS